MGIFGWSYPPGAANDPFAPYNMIEQHDNSIVEEAFSDYDSLAALYRSAYKYTACGPSIGAQVHFYYEEIAGTGPCAGEPFEKEVVEWFYCDQLRKLGTWKEMKERGMLVLSLCVSSIVEGVDQTTETIEVPCDPEMLDDLYDEEKGDKDYNLATTLRRLFWKAVEDVNTEAGNIWNETHGCDTCRKHWKEELDVEFEVGDTEVWSECPECKGSGTVI